MPGFLTALPPPPSLVLPGTHPLASQLDACWLFQEQEGTVVHDLSGRGNHMTVNLTSLAWDARALVPGCGITGAATTGTGGGTFGTAFPALTAQFSVEAYFVSTENNGSSFTALLCEDGTSGGLYIASGSKIDFRMGGTSQQATETLQLGRPYHVIVTYENPTLRLYIDGVLNGVFSNSSNSFTPQVAFNNTFSHELRGTISLIRTWRRRCLTAQEVRQLADDPYEMFFPLNQFFVGFSAGAPVLVEPSPVTALWITVNPTVSMPTTLTPAANRAVWTTTDPAVVHGSVAVAPTAGRAVWGTTDPTVDMTLRVTPAPATALWSPANPTVVRGSLAITPAAGRAVWTTGNPNVSLPVSVTPAPAMALWTTGNPTVTLTTIVTPAVNRAVWTTVNPPVVLGSVTITPAVSRAVWLTVNPSVPTGDITVTPAPLVALWTTVNPTVLTPSSLIAPSAARALWTTNTPGVVIVNLNGHLLYPRFSKGALALQFTRSYGYAVPYPVEEVQRVRRTESRLVHVIEFGEPDVLRVLPWTGRAFLPHDDYLALKAFLADSAIRYKMFSFQFQDVDGVNTTVRYWGGLETFQKITPTAWQGTLTLLIEPT